MPRFPASSGYLTDLFPTNGILSSLSGIAGKTYAVKLVLVMLSDTYFLN